MTRRPRHSAERATDREVGVVAAVLAAGSEKAAALRLGLSHSTVKHHLANARFKVGAVTTAQLVWILAPRLPEPDGMTQTEETPSSAVPERVTKSRHAPKRRVPATRSSARSPMVWPEVSANPRPSD